MAVGWMWRVVGLFICVGSIAYCKEQAKPIVLNEANWKDVLEGEWLLKFYAPWCPACRSLAPTWESVAGWSEDLSIKVGHIDVTENPGLSGRFLVTALPTIYHVKDGQFRQYSGSRGDKDFISFVDDRRWESIDPIPWWKAPNSLQMSALGLFFRASMLIRSIHSSMTEDYNIPVWGSYAIFAVLTILVGLMMGLVIVCMCDLICPPRRHPPPVRHREENEEPQAAEKQEEEEAESDVIEDDGNGEGESKARRRKPQATTD